LKDKLLEVGHLVFGAFSGEHSFFCKKAVPTNRTISYNYYETKPI